MRLSPGELQRLAAKAIRGAGASWGTAEEAGMAVRWLETRGHPGARALADLLHDWPGEALTAETGHISSPAGRLCPLAAGMAISDHADLPGWDQIHLTGVVQPLLLRPFLEIAGYAETSPGKHFTRRSRGAPTPAPMEHPDIDETVIACLDTLAQETYVPASAASRLAGAGAGLSDND
ncbi:MAG: DUF3726 domain-containing protein [Pseudomonadota bacterium]